ncbi:MAG: hypothetical protein DHS20C10_10270 [marine bacterium B5-7]|nr:MAG: hypothetical protein DHS20C10_10270 [marine bacterium B5-7]
MMKRIYYRCKWFFYFLPLWANWLILLAGLGIIIGSWYSQAYAPLHAKEQGINAQLTQARKGNKNIQLVMKEKRQFIYQDDLLDPKDAELFLKTILATNPALTLVNVSKEIPYELGGNPIKPGKKKRGRRRRIKKKKKSVKAINVGPSKFLGLLNAKFIRHDFAITFKGTFSATLNYLQQLEDAKQPIFYKSIEYTVEKPPQATVKLHVYTINKDKEWFND